MQQLTCRTCETTWERPPQRGRPPTTCDDCKAGKPKPRGKPKAKPQKPVDNSMLSDIDLSGLPPAGRTSGWCTDYDPAPLAQHEKCDGDLGKYRCPCECHGDYT